MQKAVFSEAFKGGKISIADGKAARALDLTADQIESVLSNGRLF